MEPMADTLRCLRRLPAGQSLPRECDVLIIDLDSRGLGSSYVETFKKMNPALKVQVYEDLHEVRRGYSRAIVGAAGTLTIYIGPGTTDVAGVPLAWFQGTPENAITLNALASEVRRNSRSGPHLLFNHFVEPLARPTAAEPRERLNAAFGGHEWIVVTADDRTEGFSKALQGMLGIASETASTARESVTIAHVVENLINPRADGAAGAAPALPTPAAAAAGTVSSAAAATAPRISLTVQHRLRKNYSLWCKGVGETDRMNVVEKIRRDVEALSEYDRKTLFHQLDADYPLRSQPEFHYVVVEGFIGSGKTTFCKYLKQRLRRGDVVWVNVEPIDEWEGLLAEFYQALKNKATRSGAADVLEGTVAYHHEGVARAEQRTGHVVTERGLESLLQAFAVVLSELGLLSLGKYEELIDRCWSVWGERANHPIFTIYFEISFEEAIRRIEKRAEEEKRRAFEKDIDKDYLRKLYEAYQNLFPAWRKDVIRVDAGQTEELKLEQVVKQLERLVGAGIVASKAADDFIKVFQRGCM